MSTPPSAAVLDRIRALRGIRARYLAYQQDRVNEHDHHGAWDVAINLSETECEIAGLTFALEQYEPGITREGP